MRRILNRSSFLCLFILFLSANFSYAQDSADVTVIGSGIVNALVELIRDDLANASISIETTGTAAGIDQFCNGNIDIATASRAISGAEDAICIANDVSYSEFLLGHKIVAFVAHDSVPVSCLRKDDLDSLLKPSVSNQSADWSQFAEETDTLSITVLLPATSTLEYAVVDELVVGDGLRRDAVRYENLDDAIARIAGTQGALAIMSYSAALDGMDRLTVLELENESAECAAPAPANVEADLYPAAQSLYLYVNRARLANNEVVKTFMLSTINGNGRQIIADAGFVGPSAEIIALNQEVIADPEAAVPIGDGDTAFVVPENLNGAIEISGAANLYPLLDRIAGRLTSTNIELEINLHGVGQAAGITSLCADDTDIVMLDTTPDSIDLSDCDANGIATDVLPVGSHATVLLANLADNHSQCLTLGQINTIWNAASTDKISAWSEVSASMPAQDMILFGLRTTDRYADILLRGNSGAIPPIRRDTEQDNNALYRAAAVANVPGSLTYMSWGDYLSVLDNGQENIQLVSVDAGAGCVAPSESSIGDGTYVLSRPAHLLINQLGLADENIQSLLWSLFTEDGWPLVEREGLIGLERADLPSLRRQLETRFLLAESIAPPVENPTEGGDSVETTEDNSE